MRKDEDEDDDDDLMLLERLKNIEENQINLSENQKIIFQAISKQNENSYLQLGDLIIQNKQPMKTLKKILKNKDAQEYLQAFKVKKINPLVNFGSLDEGDEQE